MIEVLYKKKVIRDFLSLFTENNWKPLIASLVEYGIINIKKQHNIASSTADEIINIVESLKRSENLIENKQKLTINKILNKNTNTIANKSSQSRSRSVSKTNSENIFKKNIEKKSVKSTSISKTSEPLIKTRTFSKKEISSKKSSYNFPSESHNNKNLFSVKAAEKIHNENYSTKLIRSSSKDEKSIKNQFAIKKYSKNLNESDSDGKWNNKCNNIPALNKSHSTLDQKTSNNNHQDRNNFNANTEKKQNTNQILEQINLQKLKEKMKKNEPEAKEEEIKVPNLAKKYSKVGSKIRSEIDKDKKIFNLIKTANEREAETSSDNKNININTNTTSRQINIKNSEQTNNNPNRNRLDSESETAPSRPNNHMMCTRANLASTNQEVLDKKKENSYYPGSTAPLSLEDRLNGLTRKICEVEKNSKYR